MIALEIDCMSTLTPTVEDLGILREICHFLLQCSYNFCKFQIISHCASPLRFRDKNISLSLRKHWESLLKGFLWSYPRHTIVSLSQKKILFPQLSQGCFSPQRLLPDLPSSMCYPFRKASLGPLVRAFSVIPTFSLNT